jgi:CDK inhibitor PHO81
MQALQPPASKLSSRYIALEEGFRQFSGDLQKLQVYNRLVDLTDDTILTKDSNSSKRIKLLSPRY